MLVLLPPPPLVFVKNQLNEMRLSKIFQNKIKIIFIVLISFFLLNKGVSAIEQYTAHGGPVKGLAVSSDNKLMASASFAATSYPLRGTRPPAVC